MSIRTNTGLALALALLLAACGGGGHPQTAGTRAPVAAPADPAGTILNLLINGQIDPARKQLKAALKRDPANPSLRVLQDSLDRDPKELLGPSSYPYTVKKGDTMISIAEHFLGNRLKAYQLARYNGLTNAAALIPGQALRIPGEPPRVETPRVEVPRHVESEPERPVATPSAKPTPKPVAKPAQPAANPAAARQLRAAGLTALNQGKVGQAIALLSRASTLDPSNPTIANDLARARRIAATVRAHR